MHEANFAGFYFTIAETVIIRLMYDVNIEMVHLSFVLVGHGMCEGAMDMMLMMGEITTKDVVNMSDIMSVIDHILTEVR